MKDLISVIVPVYNKEKTITKCIDSILNQTYKNIEVIVVNDGSTDNSKKILENKYINNSKIKIIDQPNSGVSFARKTAFSLSSGNIISFIDADDFIHENMFFEMLKAMKKEKAEVVECSVIVKEEKNEYINKLNRLNLSGDELLISLLSEVETFPYMCNKIYSKEVIKEYFFKNYEYSEDYFFNIHIFMQHIKKVNLNTPYYYYIKNNFSVTNKNTLNKVDILCVSEKVNQLLVEYMILKPHINNRYINDFRSLYYNISFFDQIYAVKLFEKNKRLLIKKFFINLTPYNIYSIIKFRRYFVKKSILLNFLFLISPKMYLIIRTKLKKK